MVSRLETPADPRFVGLTSGENLVSTRTTFVRSLHDLGAAAWFRGSLMGALGVNGAAAQVRDPTDRARVAAAG